MVKIYTARYTRTDTDWKGQLLEWPGLSAEGEMLDACRDSLAARLHAGIEACHAEGTEAPYESGVGELMVVDV